MAGAVSRASTAPAAAARRHARTRTRCGPRPAAGRAPLRRQPFPLVVAPPVLAAPPHPHPAAAAAAAHHAAAALASGSHAARRPVGARRAPGVRKRVAGVRVPSVQGMRIVGARGAGGKAWRPPSSSAVGRGRARAAAAAVLPPFLGNQAVVVHVELPLDPWRPGVGPLRTRPRSAAAARPRRWGGRRQCCCSEGCRGPGTRRRRRRRRCGRRGRRGALTPISGRFASRAAAGRILAAFAGAPSRCLGGKRRADGVGLPLRDKVAPRAAARLRGLCVRRGLRVGMDMIKEHA